MSYLNYSFILAVQQHACGLLKSWENKMPSEVFALRQLENVLVSSQRLILACSFGLQGDLISFINDQFHFALITFQICEFAWFIA